MFPESHSCLACCLGPCCKFVTILGPSLFCLLFVKHILWRLAAFSVVLALHRGVWALRGPYKVCLSAKALLSPSVFGLPRPGGRGRVVVVASSVVVLRATAAATKEDRATGGGGGVEKCVCVCVHAYSIVGSKGQSRSERQLHVLCSGWCTRTQYYTAWTAESRRARTGFVLDDDDVVIIPASPGNYVNFCER